MVQAAHSQHIGNTTGRAPRLYKSDCVRRGADRRSCPAYTSSMNPEEREQMNRLCERIQVEQDPRIFTKLVGQLNELLERKEQRLASVKAGKP